MGHRGTQAGPQPMSQVTSVDLASRAEALRRERRYDAAAALLERAVAEGPGDFACLLALARCYRSLGRFDDSDRLFRLAIESRPEEMQARAEHVRMLVQCRLPKEARHALGRALALAPYNPQLAVLAAEIGEEGEEGDAPLYAQLEYGAFKRLWALNEDLNRKFKKDPGGAVIGLLEAALVADCHDTALGLARFVMTQMPGYMPSSRAKALSLVLESLLAHGEVEAARAALIEHFDVVHLRDELMALCSRLMAGGDAIQPEYLKVPSGGLNAFYLDGMGAAGGEAALKLLFCDSVQFLKRPDNHLLLASHFARQGDAGSCRDFVNRFLAAHGMESVTELVLGTNILAGLAFDRPPPTGTTGPLVSVVMAARNAASMLGYSVRSILEQTHMPVEVLLCDDASEDGTLDQAVELFGSHPRVRLFRSAAPQGPYNIRNALIGRARGEYLTFHDADDLALPTRLARQLAFLGQTPEALAVCGQWCRVTPQGRFVFFKDQSALRLATVSILARREAFLRYGPYDAVLHGADTDLIERMRSIHGNAVVQTLKQPLLFGLWSESSLTRQIGSEATEDGFRGEARRQYSEAKFRQRFELASHGAVQPLSLAAHMPPRDVVAVAEKEVPA